MKKLGVIGGLGPIATEYFYDLTVQMTDAKTDQEHIEMIVYSKPSIPDRTEYILGKSNDNPIIPMIEVGKFLAKAGVDYLTIPCITGHNFYDIISEETGIPIIHMVREIANCLANKGVKTVGIMATEGTIYSKLFQTELENHGINSLIPSQANQDNVSWLIYKNIKANQPPEMDRFNQVSEELWNKGAEVIILGCTELSLIKRDNNLGQGYIDGMEVLAKRSIELCGGKLKDEYKDLFSKRNE
ncbi:MAG TPA: aspartate/glutamate racemase family protein [Clostridiales bacterium]|nr:aspartate/glutamate racemase family protein [Clostridiales bacterium]